MNNLISIIIPIYNSEKSINKCVNSILNQTYKNIEIILVDDGSTDNSLSLCKKISKIDSRIKVIHKENGGVSAARNTGLANSHGEFISFVDSDDYIEKDMFEKMINEFQKSNADIIICNILFENEKGNVVYDFNHENFIFSRSDYPMNSYFVKSISGYAAGKIISRKLIFNNNILFNINVSIAEDDLFNFDIFRYNKTIKYSYINDKLYHYVLNSNSATNSRYNLKKLSYFDAKKEEIDYLDANGFDSNYLKADYIICFIRTKIIMKKSKIKPNKHYYYIYEVFKKYKKNIKTNNLSFMLKLKYIVAVYLPFIYRILLFNKFN